jgi:hypothetical protein
MSTCRGHTNGVDSYRIRDNSAVSSLSPLLFVILRRLLRHSRSVILAMSVYESNFLRRHEKKTLVFVNLLFLLLVIGAGEVVARLYTQYAIGYYADTRVVINGLLQYPWGVLPRNSQGFYDEEFDTTTTKPRVGWFGDSVAMGLGAGYPYRISDIVRARVPDVATWNFGGHFGDDLDENGIKRAAEDFKLRYVVYVMNLNDIIPPIESETGINSAVYYGTHFVRASIDYLRARSYLYNRIRTGIKNIFQRYGYEASGYYAYELWPNQADRVFRYTAGRVNALSRDLRNNGTTLCVVIAPYEMQISKDAAWVYASLGFRWEDGFTEGSAQHKILSYLDPNIPVYDGRDAFSDKDEKVGHYFVYDKGDKIDWNHPNRAGHAALTEGFLKSAACPFLKSR